MARASRGPSSFAGRGVVSTRRRASWVRRDGGGPGEDDLCVGGMRGETRRSGLGPVCETGRQLLAARRELVGWLVLEGVRKKAGSGPPEVMMLSWCGGVLVVNGVGVGEARIC